MKFIRATTETKKMTIEFITLIIGMFAGAACSIIGWLLSELRFKLSQNNKNCKR